MNSTDDLRKDCGLMASRNGSGNNQCHNHRDAQPNNLQNCKVSASSNKASVDVDSSTQVREHHKESVSGASVPENIFSSVVSSPVIAPAPTFTFHVSCENGIKLFVDLKSSPSDWIESLKSGVHVDHVMQNSQSLSFHEDIGLLSYRKQKNASIALDKETDKGQLQDGSCPVTILTNKLAETDEPDEGEGLLTSPGLKSLHNPVHSLEISKDEQGSLSSRLESGTEEKLVEAKSNKIDATFAADSDVNAAVQTRTYCSFLESFVPADPECSVVPAHQGANTGNDNCVKPPLQQTSCSLDPVLKFDEVLHACLSLQESACATTNKDIKYSPSGNGGCINVADQIKKNEMVPVGIVKSVLNPNRNELEMWPTQAVDKSTCLSPVVYSPPQHLADNRRKNDKENKMFDLKFDRLIRETESFLAGSHSKSRYLSPGQAVAQSTSLSPVVNNLPQYLADNRRKKDEENRIFDMKFVRQIRETEAFLVGSYSKNRYFPPGHRFVSQDVIDISDDSETENVGCRRTQEVGSEIDELQQKNAALNPCCNDRSVGLAVPEKNGVDHHISTKYNDLILDIRRSPSAGNVSGQSNAGHGLEGSECLNSDDQMEKPQKKSSDPESTGVHRRKRNFNSVEHQSKSVNTEAKILRSSKQFAGNGHSERRRSLRLFNK